MAASWSELNGLQDWPVKLIVTCREDHEKAYGRCMGEGVGRLYLQGFGEEQIQTYVQKRMLPSAPAGPPDAPAARGRPPGPGAAGASVGGPAAAGTEHLVEGVMTHVSKSRIRAAYATPFKLNMGVDLLKGGALAHISRESHLYEGWLRQKLQSTPPGGAEDLDQDLRCVEQVAWDLHAAGTTLGTVGDRGRHLWFQRCPLRIHNYAPNAQFSFQHKSLQEYLVASRLYRELSTQDAQHLLGAVPLASDLPVLRFFGDLCAAARERGCQVDHVYQQLTRHVAASAGHPERGLCATNSISLLNAAGVSLTGMDLQRVCIPGANLQVCGGPGCSGMSWPHSPQH